MWAISRIVASEGGTIKLENGELFSDGKRIVEPKIFKLLKYEEVKSGYLIEGKSTKIPPKHYFLKGGI